MKKEWIQLIIRLCSAFLFVFQIGISLPMIPAGVEESSPGETGVYQEYFPSYNNLDYVQDREWDRWEGLLRIAVLDGVNQEQPQVASDNNGNTYIVWQDERSGDYDIYAQKLDGSGNLLWESDVRVNSGLGYQKNPDATIDLNGDMIVVWEADSLIYAQKLDEDGNRLWADDVYVAGEQYTFLYDHPDVVVDSNNDIVIVYAGWGNFGGNIGIWGQKLDESGNLLWPDFIFIGGADNGNWVPAVAVDNDDDIIVAWIDSRNEYVYENDVYAIKMSSNHVRLWGAEVRVNSDNGFTLQSDPKIITSAIGNVYVVWADYRNGDSDIYAQKLNGYGSKLWPVDVRVNSDSGTAYQGYPDMTNDGASNFAIVWEETRNGNSDIFAQKLNHYGHKLLANDVQVNVFSLAAEQRLPTIVLDNNESFVVAWEDDRNCFCDIYAQKMNTIGSHLWESDVRASKISICTELYLPVIFH